LVWRRALLPVLLLILPRIWRDISVVVVIFLMVVVVMRTHLGGSRWGTWEE
jgi:hypothetical protein